MPDPAGRRETSTPTLPGPRRRGVAGFRPRTVALLVGGIAFAVAAVADRWVHRIADELIHQQIAREATPSAIALETAINQRMALLQGLATFVRVNWERPTMPRDFDAFAAGLLRSGTRGVRTLQYVVDGRIRQTWPLKGNEAAIGRDLLADPRPEISGDLRHAMASDGIILSGPAQLYQGGLGLIGRLAVRDASGRLLAVAAVVLDLAPVLDEAGFGRASGLSTRLLDQAGNRIAGSDIRGTDPVRVSVSLPDRRWTLEAVPSGGWDARSTQFTIRYRIAALIVTVLLACLAFLAQSRQLARMEVEQALARHHAEERFARLFALIPDGVVVTRLSDGLILEVNDGFVEMSGFPRDRLVGRTTLEAGLWSSSDGRDRMMAALGPDRTVQDHSAALPTADGHLREARISGRVVEVDGVECLLTIVRDVHEQRQLERRLAEAARLEAVGRLAGGIAHDFNNLITAVAGYAQLLRERVDHDPDAQEDLIEITRAAGRAAELTRQLLAFARKQVVQPRVVDANTVLVGMNNLLKRLVGDRVTVTTTIAPSPARILIDPSQLEQVLTNLAVNARDAMPEGGSLHVQTTVEGNTVVIAVTDTGTGVPPEVREHLFEPFFTTKPAGQGTGLGLATCYGIVQQAGGRIEVTSRVGEWTTFRITLPLAGGAVREEPAEVHSTAEAPRGRETILVAEDEAQVRKLAERVLTRLGYRVLVASDGREAVRVAEEHDGPIDLLLTDMVMPGMGGGELARRIADARPSARRLLMSGYSEELVAAEHGDAPFIGKPFTPAELAEAVRRVLDAPRE